MKPGMKLRIGRTFHFEAGHHLPYHQGKCLRQHGHNYKLTVEFGRSGCSKNWHKAGPESGMIVDFGNVDAFVKKDIIDVLDHQYLNDIEGLENPTAENMVLWIRRALLINLNTLENNSLFITKIILWENEKSYAYWEAKE